MPKPREKAEPAAPPPIPNAAFVIPAPIEPMLAKAADKLPRAAQLLYEPKWDGFRAIVFRGGEHVYIQSRDLRPLDRYFPELHELFARELPDKCVLDGEIVIATERGLDLRPICCSSACIPRPRAPPSSRKKHPRPTSCSMRWR